MSHHPDTHQTSDNDDGDAAEEEEAKRQRSIEIFVAARTAFESLAECPEGLAILRTELEEKEKSEQMTDEEFDAWFLKETGHDNPFHFDLDPATMREVADMHDEVSHGLDRDGGMWHLASLVSQSVKGGKQGGSDGSASILKLEAGNRSEEGAPPAGSLNRRRKRKNVRF